MTIAAADRFKSRFLVGVFSTSIGTLAPMIVSFAGMLLVLRWVDQAALGVYMLLQVIVQFFSIVSELGVGSSFTRNVQLVHGDDERREMIRTALAWTLLVVVGMGLLSILARPMILWIYRYELLGGLLWYLPVLLVSANVNGVAQAMLQGTYRYGPLMAIRLGTAVVRFVAMILLVKTAGLGVRGLILADLLAGAVAAVAALAILPVRGGRSPDRRVLEHLLRFGFPLYLNNLLSFTFNRIDMLMIGRMTDAASVAACEVAERIPNSLKIVLSSSFMMVFFPSISELLGRQERDRACRLANMSLRVLSFVMVCVALVVALFQDEIVILLYSREYLESATAFTIFMLALPLGMAGTIMGTTLVAAGFSDAPVKINLVAVSVNILGNLVLIPLLGFTGAALATFLMVAVTLPVNQWYLGRKVFRIDGAGYLLPQILALLLWGARHLFHLDMIWLRLVLLVAFPCACLGVSMPLRRDVIQALHSGLLLLRRRLGNKPALRSPS